MVPQDKRRQQALIDALQSRATATEVIQFKELLDLLFQDVKDNLVTANIDTIAVLQGEARAYQKIMRMLDRPSITTMKQTKEIT